MPELSIQQQLTRILASTRFTGLERCLLCCLVLHDAGKTQRDYATLLGLTGDNISRLFTSLYRTGILSARKQGRRVVAYDIHFERLQETLKGRG